MAHQKFDPWLEPWELTPGGLPLFRENEFEVRHATTGVHVYIGDEKAEREGNLVITTHRLLWQGVHNRNRRIGIELRFIDKIAMKAGAFMSLISSKKIVVHLKARSWSPGPGVREKTTRPPAPGYIMLSFHDGHIDECMQVLDNALKQKAWTEVRLARNAKEEEVLGRGVGIKGLIKKQREQTRVQAEIVTGAFDDLNSLMQQARVMVEIANKLKNSQDARDNPDEYDDLLGNLGIVSPVTKEAAGKKYHELLARQLSDFLDDKLESGGGMMSLIDVYCLYNRARGTDLVSPDDFKQACKSMGRLRLPVILTLLPEGTYVLQSRKSQDIGSRILQLFQEGVEWLDERVLSEKLRISVKLAANNLNQCEQQGLVVRDQAPAAVRFHKNFFMDEDFTGPYLSQSSFWPF